MSKNNDFFASSISTSSIKPTHSADLLLKAIQEKYFLEPEKIESFSLKVFSLKNRANLKASCYWLNQYQREEVSSSEQVNQCLETIYHLKQAQKWELASQVLFIPVNNQEDVALYQQLGNLGWFREQVDCYLGLAGKISRSFDYFCLKELGDSYMNLCQFSNAHDAFQKLLQLALLEDNPLTEAKALEGLGLSQLYLGEAKLGLELCRQSLQCFDKIQVNENLEIQQQKAQMLVTASFVAVYQRKNCLASDYAEKALAIARQIKDQKTEWFALTRLATSYCQQGQNKKAFYYIEQQYLQRHQIKDLRQINIMLTCFCVITCSLRKFDLAINALQEGIQLQKKLGDTNRQYHLLSMLAYIYLWRNEYQSAISSCQECLRQSKRYGYLGYQAMSLAQLSYIYSDLGNLKSAKKFAMRSLAITRHFNPCLVQAASFASLSLVYLHQRKWLFGIALIQKSLAAVAPITSGDSKVILAILIKRLVKTLGFKRQKRKD